MKKLIVTDTHLGLYNDSDLWLDITLKFFKDIVKYCIKNNIKEIYHLGDFFDDRKSLNTKTQHQAHRIAKILKVAKDLHVYIIVGNHDCYYKNKIHPNTLELFKEYDNITIIDEITKIDDILLVPWGNIPESTQGSKYCFGHFAINGFHMNDSIVCSKGIDKVTFKDFDMVLSGHFHSPSINENIIYVGAPYGQDFHDAGGVRGFNIFEDGKLDFIEYNNSPKFVKIHTTSDVLNEKEIEGNIVKIIFTEDFGTNRNQNIIDNVVKYKPLGYSLDFSNISSDDSEDNQEVIEMDNRNKIIDAYIDSQTFPENIKKSLLKNMFKKIMEETNENNIFKTNEATSIECISVGFQNFLSFGSQWQEIDLKSGINFVTGWDEDKKKSNGAGKSSFLEAIVFALFGKTAREIRQDQIINWKNRKNCKVIFKFRLNNNLYEIERTLKPNDLTVKKNSEVIDKDSHKSDYQIMFEEIFGMNIDMFMSLIYSNINSSSNILSMKKNDKRVFLDRMFSIQIYSNMNKTCNDKLRDIDQKKYKIKTDIDSYTDKIETSKNLKIKFEREIESKKLSFEDIKTKEEEIEKLKNENPKVVEDLLEIESKISSENYSFNSIVIECEKDKATTRVKLEQIKKDIKEIENQENQRRKNKINQDRIDKIIEEFGDIELINSSIEKNEKELEKKELELKKNNDLKNFIEKELVEHRTNLKNEEDKVALLEDGKCPTCGQDVKDPIEHSKKDISSLNRKITTKTNKLNKINIEISKSDLISLKSNIRLLNSKKDEINQLKNNIKEVGSEETKDSLLVEENSLQNKLNDISLMYQSRKDTNFKVMKELNSKKSIAEVIIEKIKNKQTDLDMIKSKIDEVNKYIESLNGMITEQNENIDLSNKEIETCKKNDIKFNDIKDYLNTIKFIVKDENIKQFTIRQIMPFLNKQANHYLSEVNYNFYIKIDNWLDVEIKGPGIRNATYHSLSSGERKGVDLAIQIALLDVVRAQAGCFPDILIFDELLDSSIDSVGMHQLMKIIKTKKNEFGGKIFIISHRSEIDNELIDNEYKVVKKDSFSKVYV